MRAVYIKHSFTRSLEFRFCLMNFPYTLEFFAVAFITAICCANKAWQVTVSFRSTCSRHKCLLHVDLNENKEDDQSIFTGPWCVLNIFNICNTFSLTLNQRFSPTSLLLALKSKITLKSEGRLRVGMNIRR